ncbi:MAG: hypothetical protein Hals2KO_21110 [Halioglobus sp.]
MAGAALETGAARDQDPAQATRFRKSLALPLALQSRAKLGAERRPLRVGFLYVSSGKRSARHLVVR